MASRSLGASQGTGRGGHGWVRLDTVVPGPEVWRGEPGLGAAEGAPPNLHASPRHWRSRGLQRSGTSTFAVQLPAVRTPGYVHGQAGRTSRCALPRV